MDTLIHNEVLGKDGFLFRIQVIRNDSCYHVQVDKLNGIKAIWSHKFKEEIAVTSKIAVVEKAKQAIDDSF